jgi:hypothetical protein
VNVYPFIEAEKQGGQHVKRQRVRKSHLRDALRWPCPDAHRIDLRRRPVGGVGGPPGRTKGAAGGRARQQYKPASGIPGRRNPPARRPDNPEVPA